MLQCRAHRGFAGDVVDGLLVMPVNLEIDGTFSGNNYARDQAIALIRKVLARIGTEVDAA
jgi:hypothetical protein